MSAVITLASIRSKLSKPYRVNTSATSRWINCALFGGFVFLFLLIFKPFGLSEVRRDIVLVALGYGLTTFMIMSILNVVLIPLFSNFFNEERWNVGMEVSWNLLNIALIGIGNVLYSSFIGMTELSMRNIAIFELYTIAVGAFPIVVSVFYQEARLNKVYKNQSDSINEELEKEKSQEVYVLEQIIRIPSENANEEIELGLNDLYFIRSADNYVEVYFRKDDVINKKLLRNSLKNISILLVGHTQLFRCHKSYLVNLKKIKHVSGNAQGYKLHLHDMDQTIPVSRNLNTEIKERLNA